MKTHVVTLLGLLFCGAVGGPAGAETPATKLHPLLAEALPGDQLEFFVHLTERADLSDARATTGKEARGRLVFERLTELARRSQAGLRRELRERGIDHRTYWIVNAILVRGDRELMLELAARDEVARVLPNPAIVNDLPAPAAGAPATPTATSDTEWGLDATSAPDVWDLGFYGAGVVVGGQDTGLDWDHPAIVNQYRGWDGSSADHDYNWHDAVHSGGGSCGADSAEPCDDHGHGTHTIGTVVGDDGGDNQIGMAPAAQWIGCRNMDQGVGSPATYLECFEFFLAPYPVDGDPEDGDPSLAPHVMNNSWACPPSEGCSWEVLQEAVEATRAAGIVVVVSAGNEGSGCSSITAPPAIYDAAFSVGATNSSSWIADFSSRGPVTVDGSGRMKPDVAAPGVGVRSALPGGGYDSWSGTSMAGPHVAGLVALLISADPSLAGDVDRIEQIVRDTAQPVTTGQGCGGDAADAVPNNVFGHGIVNAAAAVECLECDDGNPCTVDSCSFDGCSYDVLDDGATCDDGLFCNGVDSCQSGECQHTGDPCADGAECADSCNEAAGDCFAAADTPCGSDAVAVCDDPDSCDGAGGCLPNILEDGEPCDDGDPATVGDACQEGGECVGELGGGPAGDGGIAFNPGTTGCGCAAAGAAAGPGLLELLVAAF